MLASRLALLVCGGVELLWGLQHVCRQSSSIASMLDVAATAPSLQYGALRAALGLLVVAAMMTMPVSPLLTYNLVMVVTAHACVLQPAVALCSNGPPSGWWMMLSLAEGVGLTVGTAADFGFEPAALVHIPTAIATGACLIVGVLLALVAVCTKRKVNNADLSQPLTFDVGKHSLSPGAKRLLT